MGQKTRFCFFDPTIFDHKKQISVNYSLQISKIMTKKILFDIVVKIKDQIQKNYL